MSEDLFLEVMGAHYGTDKVAHGYFPAYRTHFEPLRHKPITLLEVGAWKGASLLTWRAYFSHHDTRIISIDIGHGPCPPAPEYELHLGDVKSWAPVGAPYDIVIDDGSHFTGDIMATFNKLFPLVKPGGWYVIEDLETQYAPGFGGNPGGSVIIDLLRGLAIDAIRDRTHGDLCPMAQRGLVDEVHTYEQIAFLKKAK